MRFRTQKARGLDAAWSLSSLAASGYRVAPYCGVLPHMGDLELRDIKYPKFARPCPVVPRHGFVESRMVHNVHELYQVYAETIGHDALGEVIVMDRLTGRYSAVMTATGVAWGKGNDGVTGGRGVLKTIPTPAGNFDMMLLKHLEACPKDDVGVYCEIVEDNHTVCLVQMRIGPKQPDGRVKRITTALKSKITRVIQPESDNLIEWDCLLRLEENLIAACHSLVWLPGQSLSSHFAVQAIASGYNVSVEDECPAKAGEFLYALDDCVSNLGDADYAALARMLEAEKDIRFWDFPRDVLLSVGVLHSQSYWDGQPHLLALRARGVMIAAKYGLAACLGEARHRLRKPDRETTVPWGELLDGMTWESPSRSYVFVQSFCSAWKRGQELAKCAAQDMQLKGHPPVMEHLARGGKLGDYPASFMGQKWEYAALCVHDLYAAVDRFCKSPNKANWGVVLARYNEIINASHNGGYLLTKWASANYIDNVAVAPALVFGFRSVMNLVWEDDIADRPRVAWLPLELKPKDGKFIETKDHLFIPAAVWHKAKRKGIIGNEQCTCKLCMWPKYKEIGAISIAMAKPCFVPHSAFGQMPACTPQADQYHAAISSVCKPAKKSDEHVGSQCGVCGKTVVLGQCQNALCDMCPKHKNKVEDDGDSVPKV